MKCGVGGGLQRPRILGEALWVAFTVLSWVGRRLSGRWPRQDGRTADATTVIVGRTWRADDTTDANVHQWRRTSTLAKRHSLVCLAR